MKIYYSASILLLLNSGSTIAADSVQVIPDSPRPSKKESRRAKRLAREGGRRARYNKGAFLEILANATSAIAEGSSAVAAVEPAVNCDEENCVDCRGGYAFNFDGTPSLKHARTLADRTAAPESSTTSLVVFYGPCDQF
ncbi:hypothetical protein THAOC_06581, partial [Thalassiosira oceanica]